MTGPGVWPRRLLLIIGVSVALRLAAAIYLGDRVEPVSGAFDQVSYDALARRVAEGHGFSFGSDWWPLTRANEPTAHWSFLYTLYLAAFYVVLGPAGFVPRVAQAILVGALHPWLVWRLSGRVSEEEGPALAAALVTAIYPYFVFYSAALVTEGFFIVAILGALWLAIELADSPGAGPSTRKWVLLGISFGVAALLRQVVLSFYPVLLAWVLLRTKRVRGKATTLVRGAVLATLVIALMIAPWTVRNYLAFGHFVPLNTNAGFAFFWGNHPVHGSTFIPVLPAGGASYESLVPEPLRGLDEAALDRRLMGQGVRFALDDPIRFSRLTVGRTEEFFKFWPTSESSLAANVARGLSFLMLVPFAVVGILHAVRRRPGTAGPDSAKWAAVLLLLFCVTHTAAHVVCWGLIRYRLPVDAVLAVFAGSGIALTAGFVRNTTVRRTIR